MAMTNHVKHPLLNHGFIRLADFMGSDLKIAQRARVSYDAEWRAGLDEGDDARLIRYLYNNKHNTPFESVIVEFEVKAPIFVFRQWHRHRTQSYNELSARYRELPNEWYVPEVEQITTQSENNKQGRSEEQNEFADAIAEAVDLQCQHAYASYEYLLELKCPRELARGILPVNMYSHMFTTMNLHNCFNFLRERLHPHAQYEIRVYAEKMLELIEPIAPVAVRAFKKELRQ